MITGTTPDTGARPRAAKIRLRDVRRTFGTGTKTFSALDGLDLDLAEGEFLCLVGPSGCGKSTLLRMLGGLDRPSAGTIQIAAGQSGRPGSAIVFQQESVFPWMTVEDNATFPLRKLGLWKGSESEEKVSYFLQRAGLERFRSYYPHQLSGGMKQRLSVARAFATEPELLLMDEPFAALDEQNKLLMQQELEKLWSDNRITVLFITHSLDEAILLGDRVVVMSSAPGRIVADVKVDLERPRDLWRLKGSPEFGQLYSRLSGLLKEQVMKAREARS